MFGPYGAPQPPTGNLYGGAPQAAPAGPYGMAPTGGSPYGAPAPGPYGGPPTAPTSMGPTPPSMAPQPGYGQPQGPYSTPMPGGPYGGPAMQPPFGGPQGGGFMQQPQYGFGQQPPYSAPGNSVTVAAGAAQYGQQPFGTGPRQAEPVEEVKRVQFHMNNGYEFSLSIAIPHGALIPRTEWIQDKDVNACQACGAQFTMFNRRHHCRRCGRVYCNSCCSKPFDANGENGDRLCKLCRIVLTATNSPLNPLECDVRPYLEDTTLSNYLLTNDYVMIAEYIRLIQNCLRNNESRTCLMQYRPQLIQKAVELLSYATRIIVESASRQQYITLQPNVSQMNVLSAKDASTLVTHSLGLLVNFTASANKQFAQFLVYMHEIDVIGTVIALLTPEVDLVKQELAIWVLRNITSVPECTPRIVEHPLFIPGVARLLGTTVRATSEFILSLIGNIALSAPDYAPRLIPVTGIRDVIEEKQIFNSVVHNIDTSSRVTQCMAMRLLGIYSKNGHTKDLVIGAHVHRKIVAELKLRVAEYMRADSFVADAALKYVRVEAAQDPMRSVNEAYFMSGACFALSCILELYDEDVSHGIIDDLFSVPNVMMYIFKSISNDSGYTCVESSYLIRVLITAYMEYTLKHIIADDQLKNDFMRHIVIVLDRPFVLSQVTDNCKAILAKLEEDDKHKIAEEIQNRLKGIGPTGTVTIDLNSAIQSNYAGADMQEVELRQQNQGGPFMLPNNQPSMTGNPYGAPQVSNPYAPGGIQRQPGPFGNFGQNPGDLSDMPGQNQPGPYGVPPSNQPMVQMNSYGSSQPQTGPYGSQPQGPYSAPPTSNPYAPTQSSGPGPYGATGTMNPYGAPPQQNSSPYGVPQQQPGPYGVSNQPNPYGAPPPQTGGPFGMPAPAANPYSAAPQVTNPYGVAPNSNPYGAGPYGFQNQQLE